MDTFEMACRVVDRLKLTSQQDVMSAQIVIGIKERNESYVIVMDVDVTRVRVSAPQMAGTGGREGEFNPTLAAAAATLAYDLNLHLGVDRRDGEIEARQIIDLAHVPERARPAAITWALRSFLADQAHARHRLRDVRGAVLSTAVLADPDLQISA